MKDLEIKKEVNMEVQIAKKNIGVKIAKLRNFRHQKFN